MIYKLVVIFDFHGFHYIGDVTLFLLFDIKIVFSNCDLSVLWSVKMLLLNYFLGISAASQCYTSGQVSPGRAK